MGNCGFKGFSHHGHHPTVVKVVTSNGGIMELYAPITVDSITSQFPGHAIFHGSFSDHPMLHSDHLLPGQLYYLLPLHHHPSSSATANLTPYRMSTYHKTGSELADQVVPRYNNSSSGVWKVKLVISPQQLSEILSQDSRTEALIESVRTVAKCGNGSSVANSDQWSVCSSNNWKASTSMSHNLVD